MSGRSRHLRDGVLITNRKTDRRQKPKRPIAERLHEIAVAGIKPLPNGQREVRMVFDLPEYLQALVSKGEHKDGVTVFPRGFVRVTSWSGEKCFMRAQAFFRDVAKDRPGFTSRAVIIDTQNPRASYSRHLTVVRGALVISAGAHEPKVFEAA